MWSEYKIWRKYFSLNTSSPTVETSVNWLTKLSFSLSLSLVVLRIMNYYIHPNIFTHVICTNKSTLRTAPIHSNLFLHLTLCVKLLHLIFFSFRQMHYHYNFNKTTILYKKKSTSIRDKKQFCFKDYVLLKANNLKIKYM